MILTSDELEALRPGVAGTAKDLLDTYDAVAAMCRDNDATVARMVKESVAQQSRLVALPARLARARRPQRRGDG